MKEQTEVKQYSFQQVLILLQMVSFRTVQKVSVMQSTLVVKVTTKSVIFMKGKTEHRADLIDLKVLTINLQ